MDVFIDLPLSSDLEEAVHSTVLLIDSYAPYQNGAMHIVQYNAREGNAINNNANRCMAMHSNAIQGNLIHPNDATHDNAMPCTAM